MKKLYILLAMPLFLCDCSNDDNTNIMGLNEDYLPLYQEILDSSEYTGIPRADDTYTYPVTPNTEEWNSLWKSGGWKAVDEANRIPSTVLSAMSTEGVLQSVLDFPGAVQRVFLAEDTFYKAFRDMIARCDAYSELALRADAGTVVCKYYNMYKSRTGGSSIGYYLQPLFEQIISQEEIFSKFSTAETKETLERVDTRILDDHSSSYITTDKNMLFFASRVMYYNRFMPFVEEVEKDKGLKAFVEKQEGYTNDMWGIILQCMRVYISTLA